MSRWGQCIASLSEIKGVVDGEASADINACGTAAARATIYAITGSGRRLIRWDEKSLSAGPPGERNNHHESVFIPSAASLTVRFIHVKE